VDLSNLFNRSDKKSRRLSTRDVQLRKRDEAKIDILTEERDDLQRRLFAEGDNSPKVDVFSVEKSDIPQEIKDPVTGQVRERSVRTVAVERRERLTQSALRLNFLNSEIDRVHAEMEHREVESAVDAQRADLRTRDLARDEAQLRIKIEDLDRDLDGIVARIADLQSDGERMAAKFGKWISGHQVDVPEIALLARGHLSLASLFNTSDGSSRLNLWRARARQLGIGVLSKAA
jgi:hypothetical protein